MNLETRIREHIDQSAPPVELSEVTERGDRFMVAGKPTIERRVLVAASLVLIIGLIGVWWIARDDEQAIQTSDDVGIELITLEGPGERVPEIEAVFSSTDPNTVVVPVSAQRLSAGYFAIGIEGALEEARSWPVIWLSDDGNSWERLSTIDLGYGWAVLGQLVEFDGSVIGIGSVQSDQESKPLVVISDDGRTFEVVTIDGTEPHETLGPVSRIGDSLVALGFRGQNPGPGISGWMSNDGREWTSFDVTGFDESDLVRGLITIDGRLVATGFSTEGGLSARAWISDDLGRTWTRAVVEAAPDAASSSVFNVEERNGVLLASGAVSTQADRQTLEGQITDFDRQKPAFWVSSDRGTTWQRLTLTNREESGFLAGQVFPTENGILALAGTAVDDVLGTSMLHSNQRLEDQNIAIDLPVLFEDRLVRQVLEVDGDALVFALESDRLWEQVGEVGPEVWRFPIAG